MKSCPTPNPRVPLAAAILLVVLSTGAPASIAAAATASSTNAPVSFHRQVRPLFQANCVGCHQPAKAKGGYVMTEMSRLRQAGESKESPILAGQPANSHLLKLITPKDGEAEMPKGKPALHELEIDLVRRWIAEGAQDDTPENARQHFDQNHPPTYTRPPVITSLDYSPDGTLIAVAGSHEILLHARDGSGVVARLIGLSERIQSVRFSPDGQWLAASGGNPSRLGEIQIWDVAKRELKLSVPVGYDTLYGVSWSPDGRQLAFGCPDKTVRAIDAETGKQVLQQMAHEDWVLDTVFSVKGSHVISVGRDMTAKLSEVATQRFVDNLTSITPGALRGGLQSVARHPTRDEVLVGGADGQPQIYQVFRTAARKIGDNAALLRKFPEVEGRIFGVDYSPDGEVIAAVSSLDGRGAVHLYAAKFDPAIPETLLKAYQKTSGEYTKEEREAIEAFTTAGVKQLHRIPSTTAPVYSVAFSPDGHELAAGTGTGVVLVIDTATGSLRMVFSAAPQPVDDPASTGTVAHPAASLANAAPSAPGETLPKSAVVVGLTASPEVINVGSRNEQVQTLIMAKLASGDTVDVTRIARFAVTQGAGFHTEISPRGLVRIAPDAATAPDAAVRGSASVAVELGNQRLSIPVEVNFAAARFDADFIRDVSPVIARLGCTAGTCHGAREGKAGFKMSLRGYDPLYDVRAMTDDLASRRLNPASPDDSLILLKATGAAPHEGGQRTPFGSDSYAILRQWVADGAPLNLKSARVQRIEILPSNPVVQDTGSRQQMRIVATYADGRQRDVTSDAFLETGNGDVASTESGGLVTTLRRGEAPLLARFEGAYAATTLTVMGDRSGFTWTEPPANNRIDELVAAKWKRMKILPSDLCSDAEFIRRVSLDLTGLPPTAAEVRDFLANPRDRRSKRDALVERLLNSPDFVDHWANKWADLLQVNRKFLGEEGAAGLRQWIRGEVASNTPYDQFVHRLLTATGSNRENPAAAYWKVLRDPVDAMESTTHLFLATRFNCNKCHDHPFERWTQDQYYQLSQFFAQVDRTRDEASGNRTIGGTAVEGAKPLFETISDRADGGVKHDRTGKVVAPAFPYTASHSTPTNAPRRQALADWMTASDNRYFASSYVNRLWGYLLGVGLIEPLDDIRAGNPPSNPELLDHLTREFVESGFNTRHILRQICQSRAYQLSLTSHRWNEDDHINFSHALPRRLPAEVLLDSVYRVTGTTPEFPGAPPGTRAAQLVDSAIDLPSGFLANLGRPARESSCECERSNDIKLSSVMSLLSGPAVSDAIRDPQNALAQLAGSQTNDHRLADELFVRILNRPASEPELDTISRLTLDLEQEHAGLGKALETAEQEWAARKPQLDRDRAQAVARAENALATHLVERAAPLAAAQRARLERIATAESTHRDALAARSSLAADWEAALDSNRLATAWIPLDPKDLSATGSARLQKLPDGSIRSTASVGELPNYTVTAETSVAGITGVLLEVLPDASLPAFGPGHKDGSFVLAEFTTELASRTNAQAFARLKLPTAAADFSAPEFDVAQAVNGIREQGRRDGWSIGTATGRPHWAAFALEKPAGDTNGSILRFTLVHAFEAPHEVGRFRLWITTSAQPTLEGLPQEILTIVNTPARRRTPVQLDRLQAYVASREPDLLAHQFRLELARAPLPEDEKLKELERTLTLASRPVPVDARVLQLRLDLAASAAQLRQRRLTATQDLAWALINTPAFLFNR